VQSHSRPRWVQAIAACAACLLIGLSVGVSVPTGETLATLTTDNGEVLEDELAFAFAEPQSEGVFGETLAPVNGGEEAL
ncbi:MAG: hypothetical protein AAFR23_10265, partial [Pseudomonadota bacterium]